MAEEYTYWGEMAKLEKLNSETNDILARLSIARDNIEQIEIERENNIFNRGYSQGIIFAMTKKLTL